MKQTPTSVFNRTCQFKRSVVSSCQPRHALLHVFE